MLFRTVWVRCLYITLQETGYKRRHNSGLGFIDSEPQTLITYSYLAHTNSLVSVGEGVVVGSAALSEFAPERPSTALGHVTRQLTEEQV